MIGFGLHIGNRVMGGGGAAFDPDAQAFFDRVTTAGGTLSTTEKNATNQLVLDMKSAGIWSSMKAVYPMVGASAAACAQNLKSSSFTGTFTSGWTFASTGVTPNGTSAFMDSNLQMQQLSNTSNGMSVYMRTAWAGAAVSYIGAFDGTRYTILGSTDGANTYYNAYNSSFATRAIVTKTGLLYGNYLVLTEKVFRNGTVVATSVPIATTASTSTQTYYLGCFNSNGSASQFLNKEIAFSSIGDGLTDTQASNFYTAVQAFQTTLNRQIP